jgi:hypothetical protein
LKNAFQNIIQGEKRKIGGRKNMRGEKRKFLNDKSQKGVNKKKSRMGSQVNSPLQISHKKENPMGLLKHKHNFFWCPINFLAPPEIK